MVSGTNLALGVGAGAGLMAMLPVLMPLLIILCCCCSSSSFPVSISSSVLFGDLRSSGSYQKAKEHFDTKEKMRPNIINQKY
jgi:hypothetical protein